MVTKTADELNEMREQIANGELPADAIKQYYADERRNVFGHDHRLDRSGKPIEQGYGSAQNMTRNSIEAYRKYGSAEVDHEKHLMRMEAELKAADARRAAERGRAE